MSDISRLFAEDPLKLTKADIGEIIARYRAARAQFNLGEKSAGSTKKMKKDEPKIDAKGLDDILKDL